MKKLPVVNLASGTNNDPASIAGRRMNRLTPMPIIAIVMLLMVLIKMASSPGQEIDNQAHSENRNVEHKMGDPMARKKLTMKLQILNHQPVTGSVF